MPNDIGEGIREWADGDEAQLNGLALATSVRDALRARTGGFGGTFDRDEYYGVPANLTQSLALQGREWFRRDTGWLERWYAPFNLSTNPGGASGVGAIGMWLPVSGNMPRIWIGGVANNNIGSSGSAWAAKTGLTTSSARRQVGTWAVRDNGIALPFPGRFTSVANINIQGATGGQLRGFRASLEAYGNLGQSIRRSTAFGPSGIEEIINSSHYSTTNYTSNYILWEAIQDSGGTLSIGIGTVSVQYEGPIGIPDGFSGQQ